MKFRQCAFLTMENPEGFFVYDQVTYAPLLSIGWEVTEVPWSAPIVPWREFEAVVIRSTWDYQDRPEAFLKTLAEIESADVRLLNSRTTCVWNMDKIYLKELADAGVATIPTLWFDRFDQARCEDSFRQFGDADRIVVKPRIGANADNIFVLERQDAESQDVAFEVFSSSALLVQPFIKSICELGEYSLFFFGDEYSHAIVKRPDIGDFRVQEEHGGKIESTQISTSLKRLASRVFDAIKATLGEEILYARIDLVQLDDGSYVLIEAELIEPSLYFTFDDESPQRFATVLNRMLS